MNEELIDFLTTGFSGQVVSLVIRILIEILIFLIGTQVIKIIRKIIKRQMTRAKADVGAIGFVDSFVKFVLYIILIFGIAANLGVDAATIVAVLGSAGVAIGLAIQGSLSNFAGGVLIFVMKPFKVGDYIIENSTHMEGTVEEILIFHTKLRTIDNHIVILPNGSLSNTSLTNLSTLPTRRMDLLISVSYQANLQDAKAILQKVLEEDAKTIKNMPLQVFVDHLGDSSVVLGVRCYFYNEDFWEGKWRITEACKTGLDEAGIEIPYNQLDVHVNGVAK